MKISRIRSFSKSVEVTLVLTPWECEAIEHRLDCGDSCNYPKRMEVGKAILDQLSTEVLSKHWPSDHGLLDVDFEEVA